MTDQSQEEPKMTDRPTYRERREARAARLAEWAEKRETRGEAAVDQAREMADQIPFGQPILTDHYSARRDRSYRNRISSKFDRGFTDLAKAEEMRRKSESIIAAADHAIYSDDHDAVERLEERIAELTAERDRIKAFNASCRATVGGDPSLLDDKQRANLASIQRHAPFQLGKRGQFPGYALSNLGGNIRRQAKRLEALRSQS